ncbi:hypothetical protein SeMB42_g03477 [Synchytrium endobioticum]|uniref:Uncharacterized protein n=1 Tax=Synchytrium endobioticum TaxID=286115 RepID=A0A507D883_9FUNG|nr:hypothetical protein SeMB42_g03477 [Synchytrium endobioticum]TPX50289.1 hypothetical protein SeLEV6574_g00985 [Synchytrium endobioticum]
MTSCLMKCESGWCLNPIIPLCLRCINKERNGSSLQAVMEHMLGNYMASYYEATSSRQKRRPYDERSSRPKSKGMLQQGVGKYNIRPISRQVDLSQDG